MKLVKSNLPTTVAMRRIYPVICSFVFDDVVTKAYNMYSLDLDTVLCADTDTEYVIVIFNQVRKIREDEIDFVVEKLLGQSDRRDLEFLPDVLEKIAEDGLNFDAKDLCVIIKKKSQ